VNWWRKSLAHSTRSKLAARASRCRTPLQAFSRASQAERPSRSPASASRCSCPSSERKLGTPPSSSARHATAAHISSSSTRLMPGSAAFTLAMSARATSSSAGAAAAWRQSSLPHPSHEFVAQFRVWTLQVYIRTIRSTPVKGLRKGSVFWSYLKGLSGGLHFSLALLLYYLRRRSPGPPFPPDHRQAGERGAIKYGFTKECSLAFASLLRPRPMHGPMATVEHRFARSVSVSWTGAETVQI